VCFDFQAFEMKRHSGVRVFNIGFYEGIICWAFSREIWVFMAGFGCYGGKGNQWESGVYARAFWSRRE
jgi:hypothetical protein